MGLSCFYRNHSEKLKAREERGARQTDKSWPAAEEEDQEIIEATLPRQDGDLMRHWTRGVSLFSHGLVEYLEGEIKRRWPEREQPFHIQVIGSQDTTRIDVRVGILKAFTSMTPHQIPKLTCEEPDSRGCIAHN